MRVVVSEAIGTKCERCWRVLPEVGLHPGHPAACLRCVAVVTGEAQDVHALAAARYDAIRKAPEAP